MDQPIFEFIKTITVGNVIGIFIGWTIGMCIVAVGFYLFSRRYLP